MEPKYFYALETRTNLQTEKVRTSLFRFKASKDRETWIDYADGDTWVARKALRSNSQELLARLTHVSDWEHQYAGALECEKAG